MRCFAPPHSPLSLSISLSRFHYHYPLCPATIHTRLPLNPCTSWPTTLSLRLRLVLLWPGLGSSSGSGSGSAAACLMSFLYGQGAAHTHTYVQHSHKQRQLCMLLDTHWPNKFLEFFFFFLLLFLVPRLRVIFSSSSSSCFFFFCFLLCVSYSYNHFMAWARLGLGSKKADNLDAMDDISQREQMNGANSSSVSVLWSLFFGLRVYVVQQFL